MCTCAYMFMCMCLCECVYVVYPHMCEWVHMHMHVQGGQRRLSCSISPQLVPLRQGLLMNLKQSCQPVNPRILLSLPSQSWDYKHIVWYQDFYVSAGDLNSCLHSCTASTPWWVISSVSQIYFLIATSCSGLFHPKLTN